jgi:hypothetical protein
MQTQLPKGGDKAYDIYEKKLNKQTGLISYLNHS